MEELIQRLEEMKNSVFIYNNKQVVVLNYLVNTGDNADEMELYLNDGRTLVWSMFDAQEKLNKFVSVSNSVVILSNERLNQVSTINADVISDLRDTVLEEIKALKNDPNRIGQAKQIFQGVNTLIGLSKAEMEYRRLLDSMDKKNKK